MMSHKVFNVLFVGTENSNRSIIAEAVLRHWGKDRFSAFSAGLNPSGQVDPPAIEMLKASRLSTEGLRSKSREEFAVPGAPQMDFVISVCDTRPWNSRASFPGGRFSPIGRLPIPRPRATAPRKGRARAAARSRS